jgi:hypothetical protein
MSIKVEVCDWQWLEHPGVFERHLQRRHNNPLFPRERRSITAEDVRMARIKDAEALDVARMEVLAVHAMFDERNQAWRPWYLHLEETRQRIDAAREHLLGIGGDTAVLDKALMGWRELVFETWRKSLANDADKLRALDEVANLEAVREQSLGSFVRQLTSPAAPIPSSELVPALLCESPAVVASFVQGLPEEQRALTHKWAAEVARAAEKEGFDLHTIKEQLYAVGSPRLEPA